MSPAHKERIVKNRNIRNQNGFTLIELVIVIVLLGTLAAVALPKFVNLNTDARIASVKALAGAVDSAADMVHARVLTAGATTSVDVEGGTVVLANGYPAATSSGIAAALKSTGNYTVLTGSGAGSPPVITTTTSGC